MADGAALSRAPSKESSEEDGRPCQPLLGSRISHHATGRFTYLTSCQVCSDPTEGTIEELARSVRERVGKGESEVSMVCDIPFRRDERQSQRAKLERLFVPFCRRATAGRPGSLPKRPLRPKLVFGSSMRVADGDLLADKARRKRKVPGRQLVPLAASLHAVAAVFCLSFYPSCLQILMSALKQFKPAFLLVITGILEGI